MEIRDLRPCDNCGEPIKPVFMVVDVSHALIHERNVQQLMGMTMMMGGHTALAEMFVPDTKGAVIASEEEPKLNTRIILCQKCFLDDVNLSTLFDKARETIEARAAQFGG